MAYDEQKQAKEYFNRTMDSKRKGCKTYRETGVCRCKLYPLSKISKKVIVGVEKKEGHCACEILKTEDNKCLGWENTKKELENNAL